MEIYFSDPSSQISWSLFSGPSGFGEFPIYGNAGFHKVYVGGIRDSKSKVERAWLTDWLLRQGLTGCLHFSECPVVPEPGPRYQKFRNSVCISSSRGTLALGDWFIKTKVTGDFLIFKQIDRQTDKQTQPGPWFFSSSRSYMVTYRLGLFISKRNFEQASQYMCNVYF